MLNKSQKQALNLLESGKNVFLSGEAGTGKSFVLNYFINKNKHKNIIVTAPTGIAAININGSTLHRTFNVPIEPISPKKAPLKTNETIQKADIIIIDEISMCRFDCFEYVAKCIKLAEKEVQDKENKEAIKKRVKPIILPPKQVIVVGDFFQLPPVITEKDRIVLENYWKKTMNVGDGFAFQSPMWKEFNFVTVVLTEQMRQKGNADFVTNLNKIRKGDKEALKWFNKNASKIEQKGIYLCATNKEAEKINNQESAKIKRKAYVYEAQINGNVTESDKATSDILELKQGMQVMSLINDIENRYQNGTLGTIIRLTDDTVTVVFGNEKVEIVPYTWEVINYEIINTGTESKVEKVVVGRFKQLPLKVAYAITMHKSQGQTYESANISPYCFTSGQLYVALSRLKSIERLYLTSEIKQEYLITSKEVVNFYENQAPINSNIDKPDTNFLLADKWQQFSISSITKQEEIVKIQKEIRILEKHLEKVGIKLILTDDIFTFSYDLEKMKRIAVRNLDGAKKKIAKKTNAEAEEEKYYTYDEVRELIKQKTAEQVAKDFGFTKTTLYRKLKQAEEREDKMFY